MSLYRKHKLEFSLFVLLLISVSCNLWEDTDHTSIPMLVHNNTTDTVRFTDTCPKSHYMINNCRPKNACLVGSRKVIELLPNDTLVIYVNFEKKLSVTKSKIKYALSHEFKTIMLSKRCNGKYADKDCKSYKSSSCSKDEYNFFNVDSWLITSVDKISEKVGLFEIKEDL